MKNLIKQILSFLLPVTVLIIIPLIIERDLSVRNLPVFFSGLVFICMGLYILIMAISTVIRIGRGTLAPWSPTKKLVTSGMYGYVRNPMITGVFIVLAGESLAMMSLNIFIWTIGFFLLNNIFFYVYEEPDLEKKFGDEYREYKKNVQRWIPKLISYQPQSQKNKSGNSG